MVKNISSTKKVNLSSKLNKAISVVFAKNLGVKKSEKVLIVYDITRKDLAKQFSIIGKYFSSTVDSVKMPKMKVNGEEPPKDIAKKMLKYDVLCFVTEKSLSHTKARRDATKKGIRIASMPGITAAILRRCVDIDYERLKKETKMLGMLMNKADKVRITTSLGTDFSFSIKGRKGHGLKAGIFTKKGFWGNIPEGEAFIAPVEETASGIFIVDGSIAGLGKTITPVKFFVEKGNVTKIVHGKGKRLERILDKVGKKARNIAELGIGLNRKAKITGVVLEDEKKYGTCHIALGNNVGFGGSVDVPLHIDCVIEKPTIWFDKKMVMKKGKLLL